MTLKLDIQQHDAPRRLAEMMVGLSKTESVEIMISGDDVCPNRIVPVIGLADAFLSQGYDIRFVAPPYSKGERALVGFNTRTMESDDSIESGGSLRSAFGRVWRFNNAHEQMNLVNAMVLELDQTANLAKGVKQCFEWCLNEVTDNVLNHSRPEGGAHGYVMVQYVQPENRLKICVFDSGIGLKERLRVNLMSNVLSKNGSLDVTSDAIGTTVDFQMVCSVATTLQDIFGSDYVSVDLWQEAREQEDGSLLLKVAELAEGFGSRESARKVRHIIENAIDNDRKFVVLDFSGVDICSSSFIDELLVKLVAKYGVLTYSSVLKVLNLTGLTQGLANFSAAQRLGKSE